MRNGGTESCEYVVQKGQPGARGESAGFRLHRPRRGQSIYEQVNDQGCRDKIEHDGRNDDMAATFRLQIGGDEGPGRAACSSSNCRRDKNQRPREEIEIEADESYAKPGYIGLTFGANIEEPGVIGDSKSQAGENEVRRVKQRVPQPFGLTKGAFNDDPRCLQWIFADGDQKNGGEGKGGCKIEQGDQQEVGPPGKVGMAVHAALSGEIPAIIRLIALSAAAGVHSPTIKPLHMVKIRSDNALISSSSTDTSRMALPRSRKSISRRWINSMAPISTPR